MFSRVDFKMLSPELVPDELRSSRHLWGENRPFSRPSGTASDFAPNPALKRWAIGGRPSGSGLFVLPLKTAAFLLWLEVPSFRHYEKQTHLPCPGRTFSGLRTRWQC